MDDNMNNNVNNNVDDNITDKSAGEQAGGILSESAAVENDISKIAAKRTIKDSVFTNLFQDKKYLLKLYQALHPEDTEATEDSLTNITIENVLVNDIYNDFGFAVGDKIMILVESQSNWTANILIRAIIYLAQSYRDYFHKTRQSLYSSKRVSMPRPELYIIYTGDKEGKPDELLLSREFFNGTDIGFEVKAKVIYEKGTQDIINQYILFAKIFDRQRQIHGLTKEAVKETIRICKSRNILKEYLAEKETEVSDIMMGLYSYEEILSTYVYNERETAMQIGEQKGLKAGRQEGLKAGRQEGLKAGRQEGLKAGRQEGLKAGRQEGLKAGREEGLKAGAKETACKTAEIMLRDGTPLEKVARYFPILSLEELKEIEAKVMQTA